MAFVGQKPAKSFVFFEATRREHLAAVAKKASQASGFGNRLGSIGVLSIGFRIYQNQMVVFRLKRLVSWLLAAICNRWSAIGEPP